MTILSADELCAWLKISRTTLYGLTRARAKARGHRPLPVLKIGRQMRFVKESVVEWLKQAEHGKEAA